jgi:hypothetical protein
MPKRGKKNRTTTRPTHGVVRDELFEAVREHLAFAARVYAMHEDEKPVLLYDLQERRLYAYPYEPFKADLTPSSQASLAEQYERAIERDQIVLFVRDNVARKLASYSLPRE